MGNNRNPEIQIQDINSDFYLEDGSLYIKGITAGEDFIVDLVMNLDHEFFTLNKEPNSEYLLVNMNKVVIRFRYKKNGVYVPAFTGNRIADLLTYDRRTLNYYAEKATKFAQKENGF